jgi:phosphate acetyltransferase
MNQGMYIMGAEPRSGKSVVVLGMMEMLSGKMGKVGLFCPIVSDARKPDALTDLIVGRYGIDTPYERLYGCGRDIARDMLLHERSEDLLKIILEKYRGMQEEWDLVVCAGSDYEGPTASLEFNLNAAAANHLGCAVMPVVNGHGRHTREILAAAGGFIESLRERKCDILALVVNRVPPRLADEVTLKLKGVTPDGVPGYVIPELTILGNPTVGEIAAALGADWLSGHEGGVHREVKNFKIAAMELPNYLDHSNGL